MKPERTKKTATAPSAQLIKTWGQPVVKMFSERWPMATVRAARKRTISRKTDGAVERD
jgi:hypothetical protein